MGGEEPPKNDPPGGEQLPLPMETSLVGDEVIKRNQAQLASLAQQDKLEKIGTIRPYQPERDTVPYVLKFKPPTLQEITKSAQLLLLLSNR